MKRFARNLGSFFLVLILSLAVGEFLLQKFYATEFDSALSKSINNFEKKSNRIEILFLGDSRVYYGVNPGTINTKKTIHNYSFASEPIQTTYWKLRYYIDRQMLDSLQTVYLLFDYTMISSDSRIGLQTTYDYAKFYNNYFFQITSTMSFQEMLVLGLKTNLDIIRLKGTYENSISNAIKNIYTGDNKNEIIESTGYSKRLYHISEASLSKNKSYLKDLDTGFAINPKPVNYYHKLVNLLTQKNIKVVFFDMPSAKQLFLKDDPEFYNRFHEMSQKEMNFIRTEFPNTEYIKFSHAPIIWGLSDFSDRGHLNYFGANKISYLLKKHIGE